ncbi:MAG: hypothetical protein U1E51_35925, partial [Candidatus Binatia bacterium]|nr:hypothetical protein [Candidatus Binatia bacterium]
LGAQDVVRVDGMQERFKEARIPYELLTTEDRAKVAIVFERINRMGVPLDTFQLLTAWTWSEEFDLQHEFDELREDLAPFGFAGVGEDSNLLLRCCSAVLAGDAAPSTLVNLRGVDVRLRFKEIANGLKGAIDFLRTNLQVETVGNLPFSTLLVPLSVFFAAPGDEQVRMTDPQRRRLIRWFWRSCFSRRFSSGVLRNLKDDIAAMNALKDDRPNALGDFSVVVTRDYFSSNAFRINSVNTKTFVLLLAQCGPLNFVSGQPVSLGRVLREYNRSEFHHLFPRSYLGAEHGADADPNVLANFAFLSKVDNNTLGGGPPSSYRGKMPANIDEVLRAALCPDLLFADDYNKFLEARSQQLEKAAESLMQ